MFPRAIDEIICL